MGKMIFFLFVSAILSYSVCRASPSAEPPEGDATLDNLFRSKVDGVEEISQSQMELDLSLLHNLTIQNETEYEMLKEVYMSWYNESSEDLGAGFFLLTDEEFHPALNWPSIPRAEFAKSWLGKELKKSPVKKVQLAEFIPISYRRIEKGFYSKDMCCRRLKTVPNGGLKITPVRINSCGFVIYYFVMKCYDNFCTDECRDLVTNCKWTHCLNWYNLPRLLRCAKFCEYCVEPTEDAEPPTSPLRMVDVYFQVADPKTEYEYRFVLRPGNVKAPWKPVSTLIAETAAFPIYTEPYQQFKFQIYFCEAGKGANLRSMISKTKCSRGWRQNFTGYVSKRSTPDTLKLSVGYRDGFPWTSRVSDKTSVCAGYPRGTWYFWTPANLVQNTR